MDTYKAINLELSVEIQKLRQRVTMLSTELNNTNKQLIDERKKSADKNVIIVEMLTKSVEILSTNIKAIIKEIVPETLDDQKENNGIIDSNRLSLKPSKLPLHENSLKNVTLRRRSKRYDFPLPNECEITPHIYVNQNNKESNFQHQFILEQDQDSELINDEDSETLTSIINDEDSSREIQNDKLELGQDIGDNSICNNYDEKESGFVDPQSKSKENSSKNIYEEVHTAEDHDDDETDSPGLQLYTISEEDSTDTDENISVIATNEQQTLTEVTLFNMKMAPCSTPNKINFEKRKLKVLLKRLKLNDLQQYNCSNYTSSNFSESNFNIRSNSTMEELTSSTKNGRNRPKRKASCSVQSYLEPNLTKKMRKPNSHK